MVAIPLAVAVGETVPQGVGEQDTVQVTPLFAGSLVTVAVNCAVAPACTVAVLGVTETVTLGLPPPPQPAMTIANPSPNRESAKHIERCTTPPPAPQPRPRGKTPTNDAQIQSPVETLIMSAGTWACPSDGSIRPGELSEVAREAG